MQNPLASWRPVLMDRLEVAVARLTLETRQERDKEAGVEDRKFADAANNVETILGELAVAKFLNVYPDLSSYPRKGGPDGGFNGTRFDTKHSTKPLEHVAWSIAGHKTRDDSDLFLFTWGVLSEDPIDVVMFVAGWLPFEEACNEKTKQPNCTAVKHARVPFYFRITPNSLRLPAPEEIRKFRRRLT